MDRNRELLTIKHLPNRHSEWETPYALLRPDNVELRLLWTLVCAVSMGVFGNASAADRIEWHELTLRGTDGKTVVVDPGATTVVCFLGTECPLAKLYAGRLQNLSDRYHENGIRFLGVVSNVQDSPAEIDTYCNEQQLRFPVVKDTDQSVADAFEATRTPEVFVVDAIGQIQYQGRIDDQYAPGITRAAPSVNDLQQALDAIVNGRPIERSKTVGVGCLITRVRKPLPINGENRVTFHDHIAPILSKHCNECHRPGEIGPMALTDYDEVVGWGEMILEVIDQHRMPPWHADPQIGEFVGERRLPKSDRDQIAAWIAQGMPEGEAVDQPVPTERSHGWQFDYQPDQVFSMRSQAFAVPANGTVEYQYFVVDPQWKQDRWVRGAQVVPGNASVVHHAIVFVRPPDGSDFSGIGWLSAYVPGQRAIQLPPGHARLVPAGSKLVFQMHYTPNGTASKDLTQIGVWLADAQAVTHEVFTQIAIDHEFEIPPRTDNHVVTMTVDSFPPNARMLGITPHMHLRGKSFLLTAQRRDQTAEALLHVPRYDFNWQHWYQFVEPLELESIESLQMKVAFDNSVANPFNPAPQEYVSWGDQTWEEMAIAFFDVAIPKGGRRYRVQGPQKLSAQQLDERKRRIDEFAASYLEKLDANGDGMIQRDETPTGFRRFGFRSVDQNFDDVIDLDEIKRAAANRL